MLQCNAAIGSKVREVRSCFYPVLVRQILQRDSRAFVYDRGRGSREFPSSMPKPSHSIELM